MNHKKIKEEIDKGHKLKEKARKSTKELDAYLEAASHFEEAAKLSQEMIDEEDDSCNELQLSTFRYYYVFEENICKGIYWYEKRDQNQSIKYYNEGLAAISKAIGLIKNRKEFCDKNNVINYLLSFKDEWIYMEKSIQAQKIGAKGREYWDEDKPIEALDYYRKASRFFKESIELSKAENLKPIYERIALGNYIGMNANIASSMAKLQLSRGKKRAGVTELSDNEAITLIKHTLEASKLSRDAFDKNPEWLQYQEGAEHMEKIATDFLKKNHSLWDKLYLYFENDEYVKIIMKNADLERYKEVKAKHDITSEKPVKLWLSGGFFLFALIIIAMIVYAIISSDFNWWQVILAITTIEVLFVIIGAFTLRSIGELSEANFTELLKLALTTQFSFLKNFLSLGNSEKVE